MKWINGMPMDAKLFPIADIISIVSGVPITRSRADKLDELVHHVTGLSSMPSKGSDSRQVVVDAVRSQLPSSLAKFGLVQLVGLIIHIKTTHDEDCVRSELISLLEKRFGRRLPLCPQRNFLGPSESVLLLQSIAKNCGLGVQLSRD